METTPSTLSEESVFRIISMIDGILSRLTAVSPSWRHRHGGPTQWLYFLETKNSFEPELSRRTTTLSAPVFPDPRDPSLKGKETFPLTEGGEPLPAPHGGQVPYSVDFRLLQVLSGLRSLLLVCADASILLFRDATGRPDATRVGSFPASDILPALDVMSSWSEADFVPNSKYWKDWPLAFFLGNPLPPCPPSWGRRATDFLFRGRLESFLRRVVQTASDHPVAASCYRLVFGLAQSKRGFATVPRSFVRSALNKHRAAMDTPPSSEPDLASLDRFLDVIFRGFRPPSIISGLVAQEASPHASNDVSRTRGGAREDLRSQIRSILAEGGSLLTPELIRMGESRPGVVFEERGSPPLSRDEWKALLRRPIADWPSFEGFSEEEVEEDMKEHGITPAMLLLPRAKVAEVLEPLKVRLITAMHALRTFVAKPLQGALWDHLRSMQPFRLIGEGISADIVRQMVDRHDSLFGRAGLDQKFVSGDYSAATDGLDIRVSKAVLERVLLLLHPDELRYAPLLRGILFEQVLEYPSWSRLNRVVQRNGQLMGSVLSFPILCIANLFTYVMALPAKFRDQFLQGRIHVDRLPVLVNGDDILFRADDEHYARWLQTIGTVGFRPSVGKNFHHPFFFTVNSVPLRFVPDPSEIHPLPQTFRPVDSVELLGFLNVGLLTGQAKLSGRGVLGALPLSGWYSGSVLPALNPMSANNWFIHYHRKEILRQTVIRGGPRRSEYTMNIFAHPLLGGLGFPLPDGVEPGFSDAQRALAAILFDTARRTFSGQARDFRLLPFLSLKLDDEIPSISVSLGHRPEYVVVDLFPVGTPLPRELEWFEDHSEIKVTPLSHPFSTMPSSTVPSCAMSGAKVHEALRRAHHGEMPLHPLDEMTSFPFLPVRRRAFEVREGSVERLVPVYAPPWNVQDSMLPSPELPFPDEVREVDENPSVLLPGDPGTLLVVPGLSRRMLGPPVDPDLQLRVLGACAPEQDLSSCL